MSLIIKIKLTKINKNLTARANFRLLHKFTLKTFTNSYKKILNLIRIGKIIKKKILKYLKI